jgi:uncharacterized coiled-coil protein SlyX
MGQPDGEDTKRQLDAMSAQLAENHADIEALQDGAEVAVERVDEADQRIDDLEARTAVHREMIAELQAEGLISSHHAADLEAALQMSRTIGAAIGILMGSLRVTEVNAFQILKKASMDRNVKLRNLAEEIVLTGDATAAAPNGRSGPSPQVSQRQR